MFLFLPLARGILPSPQGVSPSAFATGEAEPTLSAYLTGRLPFAKERPLLIAKALHLSMLANGKADCIALLGYRPNREQAPDINGRATRFSATFPALAAAKGGRYDQMCRENARQPTIGVPRA